jgi:hypothetical protein
MYSDVVVNYVSTMTLEAFVFDKPVVNIDYPEMDSEADDTIIGLKY